MECSGEQPVKRYKCRATIITTCTEHQLPHTICRLNSALAKNGMKHLCFSALQKSWIFNNHLGSVRNSPLKRNLTLKEATKSTDTLSLFHAASYYINLSSLILQNDSQVSLIHSTLYIHTYIYICIYVCMYIYIYIYMEYIFSSNSVFAKPSMAKAIPRYIF
jgi:hypothetical protein